MAKPPVLNLSLKRPPLAVGGETLRGVSPMWGSRVGASEPHDGETPHSVRFTALEVKIRRFTELGTLFEDIQRIPFFFPPASPSPLSPSKQSPEAAGGRSIYLIAFR